MCWRSALVDAASRASLLCSLPLLRTSSSATDCLTSFNLQHNVLACGSLCHRVADHWPALDVVQLCQSEPRWGRAQPARDSR